MLLLADLLTSSLRPFAFYNDSMHVPTMALIVVQSVMEHAPVIPHRKAPRLPLKPCYELFLGQMFGQKTKYRQALLSGPTLDVDRMGLTAIDALTTRFFVGAYKRMLDF